MKKGFVSFATTITCLQCNLLPCNEPCAKSLGLMDAISRPLPVEICSGLPCRLPHLCQTVKQFASEGFLYLWKQIKVTRTCVQRAGCYTVSHCYCAKGSSTGVATWPCEVPCSASGGAPVLKCGHFCCTVRRR